MSEQKQLEKGKHHECRYQQAQRRRRRALAE
jgi:hypothetical protein